MADWIDDIVEWQIQQGIRSGEYQPQPKPPAARSVAYSVLASLRHALALGRR